MSVFDEFTKQRPLLLIGCGRMGGALLAGWLDRGLSGDALWLVEPEIQRVADRFPGLSRSVLVEDVDSLPDPLAPAAIILAVKPQVMDEALSALAQRSLSAELVLSIAAGKSIGYFEERLGGACPVVRAMPNTPAAIGRGMTVAVANAAVGARGREMAGALLSAVGAFAWIDDEALMDAVTAVSGSGPAYVFYLAECLAAAGESAGLPADLARMLAINTVTGAGALLDASDEDPAILRANVTSPGGTTAAALDVLMAEDGLAALLRRAVDAAVRRGRELNG
ncbi:MAG: pyrroline-5-carboxylate reductase [Alphaproteobacteria bacterium]|nr:MAG: pyrroline-5-carboxylate reductase [Alphaproteobacteria bacterium]